MAIEHDEMKLAGDFFMGDVPIKWFTTAITLPGCNTFRVAMVIWHYWKLRNTPVRVSMAKCRQIGIGRKARNTGLAAMESAGLIKVLAESNRAPVVEVIGAATRRAK